MANALDYRSRQSNPEASLFGKASMMLGILSIAGVMLSLIAVAERSEAVAWVLGLILLGSPPTGVVLGIVGLIQKNRRRGPAIVGLCLNTPVLMMMLAGIAWMMFVDG